MKGFHLHAHVDGRSAGIAFCSRMFAADRTRVGSDCARWISDLGKR